MPAPRHPSPPPSRGATRDLSPGLRSCSAHGAGRAAAGRVGHGAPPNAWGQLPALTRAGVGTSSRGPQLCLHAHHWWVLGRANSPYFSLRNCKFTPKGSQSWDTPRSQHGPRSPGLRHGRGAVPPPPSLCAVSPEALPRERNPTLTPRKQACSAAR